jgi:hypothetical protein
LAEKILAQGDLPAAGQLALTTHTALTTAVQAVTAARGQVYVDNLHAELTAVLERAGFQVPHPPPQNRDAWVQVAPQGSKP